jgi:hypothetical protein
MKRTWGFDRSCEDFGRKRLYAAQALCHAVGEVARVVNITPPNITEVAPDFTLPDATDTPRRLADLCAAQPLVLVFYRGHW